MSQKTPVTILGATGSVGQRFVSLLENHPWFEIAKLCASDKSEGKTYAQATNWILSTPIPASIRDRKISSCTPSVKEGLTFSALSSNVAGPIETSYAAQGAKVISCSKNHRMDESVPMVIPEVNGDHIELIHQQKFPHGGYIVTKPNCSVIALCMALKPLLDSFGLEAVSVVTMQAASGAGFPGVPSLALFDNVIPYIEDEEEKMESEPNKIFAKLQNSKLQFLPLSISSSCNRIPVTEGHMEVVSVKLKKKSTLEALKDAWLSWKNPLESFELPSSPTKMIYYFDEPQFPQTRLHRDFDKGMAVHIGRLRKCPILDFKFTLLSHNTLRGAAGGALLTAELLAKKNLL